jgi:hypothetical protein
LTKLCSISLVATAIANSPELDCGQGVLHGAIQTFHYDLIDMHKLTPEIQEVIAFTMWLSDKQIQRKCVWNLGYIAIFGHLEQFLFLEWGLTRPRLILKNRQPSLMAHTFQNLKNFKFDSRLGISSTLRVS